MTAESMLSKRPLLSIHSYHSTITNVNYAHVSLFFFFFFLQNADLYVFAENLMFLCRSALKSNEGHQFLEKSNGLPKRPVRTIPLHRSQSDPSIFPGPSTPQKTDNTNTYYNMEDDASNQAPSTAQEK